MTASALRQRFRVLGLRGATALIAMVSAVSAPIGWAQTRHSAHDLRDAALRRAGDDSATCIFCHAPQGERIESARPPRWQRNGQGEAQFSIYAVTGVEPSAIEGGASLLCLSCHDATQAPVVGGSPYDHPVGVPYAGVAGPRSPLPSLQAPQAIDAGTRAHDLRAPTRASSSAVAGFRSPSRGVIDDRTVWWVATSPNSARRSRSDLPLYSAAESLLAPGAAPTIECATCHDPHNNNAMFLRIANESSRLCLSCHDV